MGPATTNYGLRAEYFRKDKRLLFDHLKEGNNRAEKTGQGTINFNYESIQILLTRQPNSHIYIYI